MILIPVDFCSTCITMDDNICYVGNLLVFELEMVSEARMNYLGKSAAALQPRGPQVGASSPKKTGFKPNPTPKYSLLCSKQSTLNHSPSSD